MKGKKKVLFFCLAAFLVILFTVNFSRGAVSIFCDDSQCIGHYEGNSATQTISGTFHGISEGDLVGAIHFGDTACVYDGPDNKWYCSSTSGLFYGMCAHRYDEAALFYTGSTLYGFTGAPYIGGMWKTHSTAGNFKEIESITSTVYGALEAKTTDKTYNFFGTLAPYFEVTSGGTSAGSCGVNCVCGICGDNVCNDYENCPTDVGNCADNKCYEPKCAYSIGCTQTKVSKGQTDEACHDDVGCSGGNCKCDGNGNCVSGGGGGGPLDCSQRCSIQCRSRGYENCYIPSNPFCDSHDCRCNCIAIYLPFGASYCSPWLGIKNCSAEGKICQSGECVSGCHDSDGGLNFEVRGICTNGSGIYYNDLCLTGPQGEPMVKEYYCSGTICANTEYNCIAYGYSSCQNGRCVSGPPAHCDYTCDSIIKCQARVNDPNSQGKTICLTTDITQRSTLSFNSKSDIVFDCLGNEFHGTIDIHSSDNIMLQNCRIHGGDVEDSCIHVDGHTSSSKPIVIKKSEIYECGNYGIEIGIFLENLDGELIVKQSYVHDNSIGILVQGNKAVLTTEESVISNNIERGIFLDEYLWYEPSGFIKYSTICRNGGISGYDLDVETDSNFKKDFTGSYASSLRPSSQSYFPNLNRPCPDDLPTQNCVWRGVCSRYAPATGLSSTFEFPRINFCPAISDECKNKQPSYSFCRGNAVYDCQGCGGFHLVEDCAAQGQVCSNGQCVGGQVIFCNSCQDCSQKLNSAPTGMTVKLNQSINGARPGAGVCIDWNYGSKVTFDCQGYSIFGEADDIGISIITEGNSTVKNCNLTNFKEGISVWTQSTILNNNFVCNNQNYDIYNGTGTTGSEGINNTCDKNDNWKDFGMDGCTYGCGAGAPPTACNITNASIKQYCGNDGVCNASIDKIELNITVQDYLNCPNVFRMTIRGRTDSPSCVSFDMDNSTYITRQNNNYLSNWTVFIPQGCEGKPANATLALLAYRRPGESPDEVYLNGYFGRFKFASAIIPPVCQDNLDNEPQYGGLPEPDGCIDLRQQSQGQKGPDHYCGGTETICNDNVDNDCDAKTDLADLDCAPPTACNITNASIKQYCGNDGVCNASIDKIELNITVENPADCKNVAKLELSAVPFPAGTEPTFPTGSVIQEGCQRMYMAYTAALITPVGKSYVGNWTVNVPEGCEGKTMKVDLARLYNRTGQQQQGITGMQVAGQYVKIAEKSGYFGQFKFAGVPPVNYVLQEISVTPSLFALNITGTQQLQVTATMKWLNNNSLFTKDVTALASYSSNASSVATVSDTGLVTGVSQGTAKITATYTLGTVTKQDSSIVIVKLFTQPYIKYINLTLASSRIQVNQETTYNVKAHWSSGSVTDITSQATTRSLNTAVAVIQAPNKVRGAGQGNTMIVSNYSHNNVRYEDEEPIIVTGVVECKCDAQTYCGQCNYVLKKWCNYQKQYECKDFCCPTNEFCYPSSLPPSQQTCAGGGTNPNDCNTKTTIQTCNPPSGLVGCYWDAPEVPNCKHCLSQGPGTCSGYNNSQTCNLDPCNVRNVGCPSGANCSCYWNSGLGKCVQNISYQTSAAICCDYSVSYSECGTCGGQTNSRTKTISCVGACAGGAYSCSIPADCALTNYQATKQECQTCAIIFRPMPFFSWWQVLSVIGVLTIVYIFMHKKKKKV